MTNSTYKNIFIKTSSSFAKSLTIRSLTSLFLYSLSFRTLIFLIGLLIPGYTGILYCSIFLYIFFIKPCINSKGEIKIFFSNLILITYSLILLLTMWFVIIKGLSIFLPFAIDLGILKFLSKTSGFKIENCENLEPGIVNPSKDNKLESKSFNDKTPKSETLFIKIYNSVFNSGNKEIITIKPFPIVKGSYIKTSNINIDSSNSNSLPTDNTLDKSVDSNYKPHGSNTSNTTANDALSYSPLSSPSSLNGTVIDIKVFKGVDSFNNKYIILKDLNDATSGNLIRVLENPDHINLAYDKTHYNNNNCTNHKFLSFETNKFNIKSYEKRVNKTYKIQPPSSSSLQEISFTIKNDALNEIYNNSLIIESENVNRLPFRNYASFASGDYSASNKWKVYIPIPHNLETISVYSHSDPITITPNCQDCTKIN